MTIDIRRYVDITSAVGGSAAVRTRELIGRIYTPHPYAPAHSAVVFSSPAAVAEYFGGFSDEYKVAQSYFGFVTKSATRAAKMAFAGWFPTGAPAKILSAQIAMTWEQTKAALIVANGGGGSIRFTFTAGGDIISYDAGDIDGYNSFANLASGMQTGMRGIGASYAAAEVTFGTGRFFIQIPDLTLPVTGDPRGAGEGTTSEVIGLLASQTQFAEPGVSARSPDVILADSVQDDDNFASFSVFQDLERADVAAIGRFMGSQNEKYLWCLGARSFGMARDYADILVSRPGVAITLSPLPLEYPELLPMFLAASNNYARRGANKNAMFYQLSGVTPAVTTDTLADELDALRINYYGQTQSAGARLAFYQRGVLTGQLSDARDINTYVNEIWLKDRALAACASVLLALEAVPANPTGAAYITSAIMSVVDEARFNDVIQQGKELTQTQRVFIQSQTGDDLAYIQVQNEGFWLNATIEMNSTAEFEVQYLLIYSKGDAIRKVIGSHILI